MHGTAALALRSDDAATRAAPVKAHAPDHRPTAAAGARTHSVVSILRRQLRRHRVSPRLRRTHASQCGLTQLPHFSECGSGLENLSGRNAFGTGATGGGTECLPTRDREGHVSRNQFSKE